MDFRAMLAKKKKPAKKVVVVSSKIQDAHIIAIRLYKLKKFEKKDKKDKIVPRACWLKSYLLMPLSFDFLIVS